jgi:hypothetical protein
MQRESGIDMDHNPSRRTIVPCKECHEHPCTCEEEFHLMADCSICRQLEKGEDDEIQDDDSL